MYYVMRASAPSLHRESTDSLIYIEMIVIIILLLCDSLVITSNKLTPPPVKWSNAQ